MTPIEQQLVDDIAGFTHDPLGFVLYAFEWGKGELSKFPHGPDEWQREQLTRIGDKLKAGGEHGAVIREAVASGHGIGKSAEVSWLILWAMSTFEDTRGVVTANKDEQLRTKTWAELSKWHRLCITRDWFTLTATAIYSRDPAHEKTWRIDAVPWSIHNTEGFAGLHNQGRRILVIMDEASGIEDKIWDVTDGAMTDSDTEIIWCVYGNMTRNTGKFVACFGSERWTTMRVDSREVRITNKDEIEASIAENGGEDSDYVRIRWRGLPPRSSMLEFIGPEDFEKCLTYKAQHYENDAVVLGMDCARFGDDSNVIYRRQGRKVSKLKSWRGLDTQASALHLVEVCERENPDAVFVDGGGPGGGIIDRAKVLWNADKIIEVNFGGEAQNNTDYANKRAEMWGEMRKAMRAGLELPNEKRLRDDLLGPLYSYTQKEQILLERKKDMKKRGLSSPDDGDAVALTFAQNVVGHKKTPDINAVLRQLQSKRLGF
jgi:hypothetical protein